MSKDEILLNTIRLLLIAKGEVPSQSEIKRLAVQFIDTGCISLKLDLVSKMIDLAIIEDRKNFNYKEFDTQPEDTSTISELIGLDKWVLVNTDHFNGEDLNERFFVNGSTLSINNKPREWTDKTEANAHACFLNAHIKFSSRYWKVEKKGYELQ